MAARVLIAGCGYVGTELGRGLVAAGDEVWGLRRLPRDLPTGIQPLAADLMRPGDLDALPGGLHVVYYAAAAGASDDASYAAAYLHGLTNLLEALSRQGQQGVRVIYTSSTGVYAESGGGWVDEDSPLRSDEAPSRHIVAGERLLLESGFPATVVRLSGIYGPGRTRLIDKARGATASLGAGPLLWTNRIHRDDCAGALAHLMRVSATEPVYLASDDEPAPLDHVLQWIAEQVGRPVPVSTPAGQGAARIAGQGKRCRNLKLRHSGYRLRFPTFRQGYSSLLAGRS